jgi:hypothetical protein
MKPRVRSGRKLLVASLGVAAVSYVACGGSGDGGGGGAGGVVGNLVGPQDVNVPDKQDDGASPLDVVANLVAPDAASD